MVVPPTGTVTFLFTDIEGSTRQAQADAVAWSAARARHHQIVRTAIEAQQGYVFRIAGDGFCAAFANTAHAVAAALTAQRALNAKSWTAGSMKVRMGLHTGGADWQNGDYEGYLTLARVERIKSLAHGGQVLLSGSTAELVRDDLPAGVSLRDLGEHRLKGVLNPEHILQLVSPDLPSDFPPLQSPKIVPNNLPTQLTSFVGRENEMWQVKQLLPSTRLLTLTGVGGTGKTRLALQAGAELLDTYQHGVWLAELAPIADPQLVPQAIASALQLREQPGRAILDVLKDYVSHKQLLIVIDNCEHLLDACANVADTMLHSAPQLTLMATSREALGLAGERTYPLPSLSIPPTPVTSPDALTRYESVRLFIERALAVQPSFALTNTNAAAVAEICRRLDGIPLAIELAAARVKGLSAEQIAVRLNDRFRLLTGGSRTALPRQRTLQAAIDWSYRLLSEDERILLRRLAAFAGGWTMTGAEAVCAGDELESDQIFDLVLHLVDKSLVAAETQGAEPRYRLLETIRQYAQEKLDESGESHQLRDRHLAFFLRFAAEVEPQLRGPEQLKWLERLETEHDNLRAALAWSLETGHSESALDLAGALYNFWLLRGNFSEGIKGLNDSLALGGRQHGEGLSPEKARADKARRAKALYAAGWLQMGSLDIKGARAMVEESLSLWRELGDKWWTAVALEEAALLLTMVPDIQTALAYLDEGIALAREVEDPWPLAVCLVRMGDVLKPKGELAAAHPFLEEGVALARRIGDKMVLSEGLRELGSLYYYEGDLTAASSLTAEALANARAIGSIMQVMLALLQFVIISSLQGDPAKARGYCLEIWALFKATGSPFAAAFALLAFGLAASLGNDPKQGVSLLAATDTMLRQHGVKFTGSESDDLLSKVYRQGLERVQAQLDPAAFAAAWAEGQQMSMEQALALATENESKVA